MKITTFLTVVVLILSLSSCSKNMELTDNQKHKIEQEIQHSFAGLVEAANALDSKRYFDLIDNDKFVGLNSDGSNWNSVADLKGLIEPGFNAIEKVESLEFTNVRISVIDLNTAILVNEFEQTIVLKGGGRHSLAGGGTQVWSRASGKWLLVSISASAKP